MAIQVEQRLKIFLSKDIPLFKAEASFTWSLVPPLGASHFNEGRTKKVQVVTSGFYGTEQILWPSLLLPSCLLTYLFARRLSLCFRVLIEPCQRGKHTNQSIELRRGFAIGISIEPAESLSIDLGRHVIYFWEFATTC